MVASQERPIYPGDRHAHHTAPDHARRAPTHSGRRWLALLAMLAFAAACSREPLTFHSAQQLASEINCHHRQPIQPAQHPHLPAFKDGIKCFDEHGIPMRIYTFADTTARDDFRRMVSINYTGTVWGDDYVINTDVALVSGLAYRLRAPGRDEG